MKAIFKEYRGSEYHMDERFWPEYFKPKVGDEFQSSDTDRFIPTGKWMVKSISEDTVLLNEIVKEPNFKAGDSIRVINYGHLIWESKDPRTMPEEFRLKRKAYYETDKIRCIDLNPELVGKEGIISEASISQGEWSYAVDGIPEKCAWYDEDQLEMI